MTVSSAEEKSFSALKITGRNCTSQFIQEVAKISNIYSQTTFLYLGCSSPEWTVEDYAALIKFKRISSIRLNCTSREISKEMMSFLIKSGASDITVENSTLQLGSLEVLSLSNVKKIKFIGCKFISRGEMKTRASEKKFATFVNCRGVKDLNLPKNWDISYKEKRQERKELIQILSDPKCVKF